MELQRTVMDTLSAWSIAPHRKPLLLYGARQVGKTYAVQHFARQSYQDYAYFNFEDDTSLSAVFEPDFDIPRIMRELSTKNGAPIPAGGALIIFDEIQRSNRALTSLKYFAEKAPHYPIIATGSMLGVSVAREQYSFPVGKVRIETMYPLSFNEFLVALGKESYIEHIRSCFAEDTPSPFHRELLGYYRQYLVVGGLPKVVTRYLESQDIFEGREEQVSLDATYVSDMAQYLDPIEAARALEVWRSLPHQLMKENRKFQYRVVKSGGRAYMYEEALAWLRAAGLALFCQKSSEGQAPLTAHEGGSFFKAYLFDTGLLCSKMLRDPSLILLDHADGSLNANFRGALAENYAMQTLVAQGLEPYYWESSGTAQIDFLYQDPHGNAIPIEVKSDDNVRSRSLSVFTDKYHPLYSIRISTKNFGFENTIKSVPFYAAFCID